MIVLDDTGFSHFGCTARRSPTPTSGPPAAGGLRLQRVPHDRVLLPRAACLLTGPTTTAVGMRGGVELEHRFPTCAGWHHPEAGDGGRAAPCPRDATYAAGKCTWPRMAETSAAGPHTNWPLQRARPVLRLPPGRDGTSSSPELTHDNHHIDPPGRSRTATRGEASSSTRSAGPRLVSVRPTVRSSCTWPSAPLMRPIRHRSRTGALARQVRRGLRRGAPALLRATAELGIIPRAPPLAPRTPACRPGET